MSLNTWQSSPCRSFEPDKELDATSSPVLLPHYLHREKTYILCHFILFYNFTQFYFILYHFTLFYNFTQFYFILYHFTLFYNFPQFYCSSCHFTHFYNFTQFYCSSCYFTFFYYFLLFFFFLYHLTPFHTKLDKPQNVIILNRKYVFTIFLHRNFYQLVSIRFSPIHIQHLISYIMIIKSFTKLD